MKKYRVIAGSSIDSLEDQVNDIMNAEGLEFVGGASASILSDNSVVYLQGITYDGAETRDTPESKKELIHDSKNIFYHGVYEHDGPEDWNVLHMSFCEDNDQCPLVKYLDQSPCPVELVSGCEYVVTMKDGEFVFDGRKLEEESA